jgi:hypothetical protein
VRPDSRSPLPEQRLHAARRKRDKKGPTWKPACYR